MKTVDRHIAAMMLNGHFAPTEIWHVDRYGREFPMLMSGVLITDESGKARCMAATAVDMSQHHRAEQDYRMLFREMLGGLAVHEILCDASGTPVDYRFLAVNPAFERLTGLKADDIVGRTVLEILPNTEQYWIETYGEVALSGEPVFFEEYSESLGTHFAVTAFRSAPGQFACIFQDITERKRAEELVRIRLSLLEFAPIHTTEEVLTKTLDEIGVLTGSPIGFFHFIEDDQETLSLRAWSTRTTKEFCKAEAKGMRYRIDQAGAWVDCVRERRPVIHNDYNSLPHGRGLPAGHGGVERELVVPVIRGGNVVAVLGIGNKRMDYTDTDVEIVSYLADEAWEITNRKRMEDALRESEARFRGYVESAPYGILVVDRYGRYLSANPTATKITGYTEEELLRMSVTDLLTSESREEGESHFKRVLESSVAVVGETAYRHATGSVRYWRVSAIRLSEERFIGFHEDITELKATREEHEKLQDRLMHAQKMESVGLLAGGVAHDFNNMLGVIQGHAELAIHRLEPDHPLCDDLEAVLKAAQRSADLTRQLLAFARKQSVAPKVLEINETVTGMITMVRRLIGEDIELAWLPGKNLWPVKMDPVQLDQILANLCVNARDAIAGVGRITIETENARFDEEYCARNTDVAPGDYVQVSVSDDGCGMDAETLSHLFEPFFTTKEAGKGTGLGLSGVYGAVKQNNGFINVYSEPGRGTSFRIYLPRHAGEATPEEQEERRPDAAARGGETILLVEDELSILRMTTRMLEWLGYEVLAANTPGEAVRVAEEYAGPIHLLMTDVVMPEMNGRDLAEKLLARYPQIRRLFMSGYTADVIARHGVLDEGVHFVQKPFLKEALAAKLQEVLKQQ